MTRNEENRNRMSGRCYPFNGTMFRGNTSVGCFPPLKQKLRRCSRRDILTAAWTSWGHIFSIIQNVSDLGKSVKNILTCNSQSRVLPRLELLRYSIQVSLAERDSDRGTKSSCVVWISLRGQAVEQGGCTTPEWRGREVPISSPWHPVTIQYLL